MAGKLTACVDFDGVIHNYGDGFGDGSIYDPPVEGTRLALEQLHAKYKIVVLTARARSPQQVTDIWEWLHTYDLDSFVDEVTNVKPPAFVYIDDNALRFVNRPRSGWSSMLNQVEELNDEWR